MKITLSIVNNFLVLCLLCFALTFMSGCGGDGLTAEQRTEIDKTIEKDGHGMNTMFDILLRGMGNPELTLKQVKYAVSKGVDIHDANARGWTALHIAASTGDVAVVNFLIANGADVNVADNHNATPLHHAAGYWVGGGSVEVVKTLVASGADVRRRAGTSTEIRPGIGVNITIVGETPLDTARDKGFTDIVNYLSGR